MLHLTVLDCFAAQLTDAVALTVMNNYPDFLLPGGVESFFLENVHCTGKETNLFDCPHRGVDVHDVHICYHIEDPGVVCRLQGIVCMLMLVQL